MELDEEFLKQLLAAFRGELDEQAELIVDALLDLEKPQDQAVRRELMERVFRAAHNIKGAARGVDLEPVADLAHKLETLFGTLKRNAGAPTEMISLALEGVDTLRDLGHGLNPGDPTPERLPALLARLETSLGVPEAAAEAQQVAGDETPANATTAPQSARPADTADAGTPPDRVLRIPAERLDRTIALADDLQVSRLEMDALYHRIRKFEGEFLDLRQAIETLSAQLQKNPDLDPVSRSELTEQVPASLDKLSRRAHRLSRFAKERSKRLDYLSAGLQDGLRMMRLVPLSAITQSLSRNAREIAADLGKRVRFEVFGDSIELDRFVLDRLRAPLTHLLRNALDHGIEPPERRAADGKPEEGHLRLEIRGGGGWINLTLEDDGHGIDVEKVRAKALRHGFLSKADSAEIEREQLLELIFLPGFSSRDEVTAVSGRGVGLDVVRANLREIHGRVWLDTTPGRGTRFHLQVPLTLATEHGLQVTCGGQDLVFPITCVDRILALDPAEVTQLQARAVVRLEGRPVRLRRLAGLLELAEPPLAPGHPLNLVFISAKGRRAALVVDAIVGEQEIVIKPFQPPLVSVRHFKGGCLADNGDIALVIDPDDLIDSALDDTTDLVAAPPPTVAADAKSEPRVLLVDDSITTRTLEKNILESRGFRVDIAVDGAAAWRRLEEESFDLVISDIEMPNMDGFALTRAIRSEERLDDLPIIIVSSLNSDENRRQAMQSGANAYIVKGEFETARFLDVVESLL